MLVAVLLAACRLENDARLERSRSPTSEDSAQTVAQTSPLSRMLHLKDDPKCCLCVNQKKLNMQGETEHDDRNEEGEGASSSAFCLTPPPSSFRSSCRVACLARRQTVWDGSSSWDPTPELAVYFQQEAAQGEGDEWKATLHSGSSHKAGMQCKDILLVAKSGDFEVAAAVAYNRHHLRKHAGTSEDLAADSDGGVAAHLARELQAMERSKQLIPGSSGNIAPMPAILRKLREDNKRIARVNKRLDEKALQWL